jgi:RNA polymerase-binding transcription factor DksA
MADISDTNVLDECEIAAVFEENDRNVGIAKIVGHFPRNRNIDELLDNELECDICGAEIPVERQRVVLTMKESCDHCAGCQEILDKKDRLYA